MFGDAIPFNKFTLFYNGKKSHLWVSQLINNVSIINIGYLYII